jgi:ABC-type uncharacterized transport system substrate-binding protein
MMMTASGSRALSRREALSHLCELGAILAGAIVIEACGPILPVSTTSRIAYFTISASTGPLQIKYRSAFVDGLRDLGYIEGTNIAIGWRSGDSPPGESADTIAAGLARLPLGVIVTSTTPALVAAAHATQTIPIVSAGPSRGLQDLGLVDSDAHPGGNVTGVGGYKLESKAVELFKETIPSMQRLAYLRNPNTPGTVQQMELAQTGASQLRLDFLELQARTLDEIEPAFASAAASHADGLMISADTLFNAGSADVNVNFPLRYHLPTFYTQVPGYIEGGGLMGFSPDFVATHRRAAAYVDKLLKGADVAALPVEQAMTFEFAINLSSARALGLTIPEDVLLQTTQLFP